MENHPNRIKWRSILNTTRRHPWLLSGLWVLTVGAVLLAMGRPLICTCGTVKLWHGDVFSPQVSQHFTDWYTLTHITHGILLFAVLSWLWPDGTTWEWFGVAFLLEGTWEIVENTEYVIQYYRQNTMAVTYYGDTVINSLSDLLAMGVGFGLTATIPIWGTVVILLLMELIPILVIRDSFVLNLIMFAYPLESLKQWQMVPARSALLPFVIGRWFR